MARKSSRLLRKATKMLGLWTITLALILGLGFSDFPILAAIPSSQSAIAQTPSTTPQQLVQQGRDHYRAGQWQAALDTWTQAETAFAGAGDSLNQAMVLSNIALAHNQLEQSSEAKAAIENSHELLDSLPATTARARILAQVLNTEATLQLAQGDSNQALRTWEQATELYQQLGEESAVTQGLINQAQALRAGGYYTRAESILEKVATQLDQQPDSLTKATGLYNLGNTLRLIGRLDASEAALRDSLTIAEEMNSPSAINAALFSLGNTARALRTPDGLREALGFYEKALATSFTPLEWSEVQVNRFGLFVETNQLRAARELRPELQAHIEQHTEQLASSRAGLYVQLNFAQNLLKLRQLSPRDVPELPAIAQLLADVGEQAHNLGDKRSKSYALGYLGQLYEQDNQLDYAQKLTEQASILANEVKATDIDYRWQWQLGRLLKAKGERQKAISAYTVAVRILDSLRQDLAVINPDIQFSFRDSVEPVYRELVALLVQQGPQPKVNQKQVTEEPNLELARTVVESLQVAELDDFFKQACLEVFPVVADDIDSKTGLLYAIDLEDQIGIILRLPGQPLRYYSSNVSETELNQTLDQLKKVVYKDPINRQRFDINEVLLPLSQKIYGWLINSDAEESLKSSDIETLTFILDGSLRNLPIAVLHDGEQYLIEKYSVALSPGLKLLNPQRLERGQMKSLAAGLSEEVLRGFPALANVDDELTSVQEKAPGLKLLDKNFTKTRIQTELNRDYFPIIHLATHGQFSSNAEDTFILSWPDSEQTNGEDNEQDDSDKDNVRINVNELQGLLQSKDLTGQEAIELLVLSACQTAEGDNRAALGLAGVAFRAGARSTVATLWPVSDEATAFFMKQFYQELTDKSVTKAEALRKAQLALLENSEFKHPFFWAPYTLIGNWL